MFPVLFSIGNLTVSSFGVFLALAFLFAVFLVWRLARAWDLDEEKILDLTLLTFFGGLLFARAHFILENFPLFGTSFLKWILITKYPGFSFWGSLLGGILTLAIFTRRFKLDFWKVSDIAAVGLLGGLILGDIGCLLGGCGVGLPSKLFIAVTLVGVLGKRFPTQVLEVLLLALVLVKIWQKATHFHKSGTIFAVSLISLGVIKVFTSSLRPYELKSYLFSFLTIFFGSLIYYRLTKRKFLNDVVNICLFLVGLLRDNQVRKSVFITLQKNWYNQKVAIFWKLRSFNKAAGVFLKKLNVKISHKNA